MQKNQPNPACLARAEAAKRRRMMEMQLIYGEDSDESDTSLKEVVVKKSWNGFRGIRKKNQREKQLDATLESSLKIDLP